LEDLQIVKRAFAYLEGWYEGRRKERGSEASKSDRVVGILKTAPTDLYHDAETEGCLACEVACLYSLILTEISQQNGPASQLD